MSALIKLRIRPCELRDANEFIEKLHRHHKPVVGHRFSISVWSFDTIHGVAVVGRPTARMTNHRTVVEVTRLCTDGTKNACSMLYSAAARIAKEMGYTTIQTFILESEPGTSLLAAGWAIDGLSKGGDWNRPSRGGRRTDQPMGKKVKFSKVLS